MAKAQVSPRYGRVSRAAARTNAVLAAAAPSATAARIRRSVSDNPSRVDGYSLLSRSNASPRNRSLVERLPAMAGRPLGVGAHGRPTAAVLGQAIRPDGGRPFAKRPASRHTTQLLSAPIGCRCRPVRGNIRGRGVREDSRTAMAEIVGRPTGERRKPDRRMPGPRGHDVLHAVALWRRIQPQSARGAGPRWAASALRAVPRTTAPAATRGFSRRRTRGEERFAG